MPSPACRRPLRSEVIEEIEFVERTLPPSGGVGDPAIDVGFLPARAVGADLDLGGKVPSAILR
jgi:hypothetical protein